MDNAEYNGRDNLQIMRAARNYNRYLLDLVLVQARNNEILVDFGAGSGTFALPVAAAGYHLVCVETDPLLCENLSGHGLKVVNSLEMLEDGSIDYLYTLNVLEHIENDDEVIKLWLKKLRPGGRLLVFVPAFQVLFSSMDQKVGHYRRYTKRMLCGKLKQAGFQVAEARYADSLGYLATLIFKAFDNGEGSINPRMLKIYDRCAFPVSRMLDSVFSSFVGKNVYACAVKSR
jgi:SAM-dependent methyltransferase